MVDIICLLLKYVLIKFFEGKYWRYNPKLVDVTWIWQANLTSKYLLIRIHLSGSAQSSYTSGLLSSIQCLVKGSKKKRKKKFTVYMAEDFSGIAAATILQHGQAMHPPPLPLPLNHPNCRWIFWWHWRHQCCIGGMDVQIISLEGMHSHSNCLVSIHLLVIILMMLLGKSYMHN